MENLSPMMRKYLETKNEYPDCILFYRLGDFYEMFFEDAILTSKELELTLTGKDCGLKERAPMCGVPHHAAENYINKLVAKGYKVAIAEQVEDTKKAKGLVKREVIQVVTPGTITSKGVLRDDKNNYLLSIAYVDNRFGIAAVDISTGEFLLTEVATKQELIDEILKYGTAEIIHNNTFEVSGVDIKEIKEKFLIISTALNDEYFLESTVFDIIKEHFAVENIAALGLNKDSASVLAAGAVLKYLYETQKNTCSQIVEIKTYKSGEFVHLDVNTRRNLELVETMRDKKKQGSLLGIIDKTSTAMGARLIRNYIEQPLVDKKEIIKRQDAIEEFINNSYERKELHLYLNSVHDIERLISRISLKSANTRDLTAFASSIKSLPDIKNIISKFNASLIDEMNKEFDTLDDLCELISSSINEEAPLSLKDGNIIKDGYNTEVDKIRTASTDGKNWLAKLEEEEREKTGIKSLKIKYNRIFGYYFEVRNSSQNLVPDYFIRKQTLANAERYTSEKLQEIEELVLGAQDRLGELEYEIFVSIRETVAREVKRIKSTARIIAKLDVLSTLAQVAIDNAYIRPEINTKGIIEIKEGRHPVVEKMINSNSFVSNDTYLDNQKNRLSIITGPNMSGKSTYMRQTALIVLLAQVGSFVPAESANISICDRIFTRVGASDDLASGQSTFMVEMMEVANILKNASKNSLIILDEIGRGTSTFDGLSIAWAVAEYISNTKTLGAKALFATHYHELTELEGTLSGVMNYCIAVKENEGGIVFLRKIVRGGADKSYGIQVAKLAGVPESILLRAGELVNELSNADIATKAKEIAEHGIPKKNYRPVPKQNELEAAQLSLFDTIKDDDIIKELRELELSKMTPLDALNTLDRLQSKIKNRI